MYSAHSLKRRGKGACFNWLTELWMLGVNNNIGYGRIYMWKGIHCTLNMIHNKAITENTINITCIYLSLFDAISTVFQLYLGSDVRNKMRKRAQASHTFTDCMVVYSRYHTQSHYPGTGATSPTSIQAMAITRQGQFCTHWFNSAND